MHNNILSQALLELQKIEDVIIVDDIPGVKKLYLQRWLINTEISVFNHLRQISLYFGFSRSIPFTIPDVFCLEFNFGDIPHIGSDHKLCLYEEGTTFDVDSYSNVIRDVLHKAKKLIRDSLENTNCDDFKNEIINYWIHQYNNENIYGFLDNILITPIQNFTQNLYKYILYDGGQKKIILSDDCSFGDKIGKKYVTVSNKEEVLFVQDMPLPERPPYDIAGINLAEILDLHPDTKQIKTFINKHDKVILVFQLFDSNLFGGLFLDFSKLKNKKGFRPGHLKNYQVLTNMELKNRVLPRAIIKPFSLSRIIKRTSGISYDMRNYIIGGLGSIGSQLTHFLLAYTQVGFSIIDDDIMRSDNIGRHLLGLKHVGATKVDAIADHIKQIRPDIRVGTFKESLCDFCDNGDLNNTISSYSALFLCTGDYLSECYMIRMIQKLKIRIPIFILWIEPYAIGGHMIYISPKEESPYAFYNSLFDKVQLYRHNLIERHEYLENSEKFIKRDAGCNGSYTNYSGNDVILYLSSMYPVIDKLLSNGGVSKCYRWFGNVNFAQDNNISIVCESYEKGHIEEI